MTTGGPVMCGPDGGVWEGWTGPLYLRLPHRNDAKIAKILNLWTFWPINHLFKIRQNVTARFPSKERWAKRPFSRF